MSVQAPLDSGKLPVPAPSSTKGYERGYRCNGAPTRTGKDGIILETVVTCVDHADILAHSLPLNIHHADRYVVVTAPEDKDTQRVARYYGADICLTDSFRTRWGEFCKGAGVNEGMGLCDQTGWILHLDADICLPPVFRTYVSQANLDTTMIYGCDRAEFKSYADWQRFIGSPQLHTAGQNCFVDVHHHRKRLGTRLQFGHAGGYIPLGFLQLWNPLGAASASIRDPYSYQNGHTDAAREDNEFSMRWPRSKRGYLPEVIVYHLESEDAPMAVNWRGRKTKPFQYDASAPKGDSSSI